MTTYRYCWKGFDLEELKRTVDPARTLSFLGPAPSAVVDIVVDSTAVSDKEDIDGGMLAQGWAYMSTDPPAQPQGIILRQELGTRLIVDTSTSSTSFVDLLTVTITTAAGVLGLIANAVSTATGSLGYLRVTVDGIPVAGGAHLVGTANLFLGVRIPVPAGLHTVKMQWRVDGTGLQEIRPVSLPDAEFANLLVREMSG